MPRFPVGAAYCASHQAIWKEVFLDSPLSKIAPEPTGMIATLSRVSDGRLWRIRQLAIIGRDPALSVHIDSPMVSREHAMIRRQDDEYYFFDLDSLNGSKVNGWHVDRPIPLAHGDCLELGSLTLSFRSSCGDKHRHVSESEDRTQPALGRTPMTILVADIVDYSQICQERPLIELAHLMTAWYGRCRDILRDSGARLDKFIGDCVFAYWESTDVETRWKAVEAAFAFLGSEAPRTELLQRGLSTCVGPYLRCGVSLHVGTPIVGAVAPGACTAIGDDVNFAFRLEEQTRELRVPMVASEAFLEGWDDGRRLFKKSGTVSLKGYPPLPIYALQDIA